MNYVKVKVRSIATSDKLKYWEERMLEKPKCWNKFCFDCYEPDELHAVYVSKEDNENNEFLTSLCADCICDKAGSKDILVNESHLILCDIHKQ